MKFPGPTNAWLMPINARLQMLSTGIKTPVGIKIAGPDLKVIQHLGEQVEKALADLPATKSVFAERVSSGRYIKITPDRMAMGKVGLTVADTEEIVASAVGGMNLTEVVEGRERYPVNLRYTPDTRDSVEKLKRLPIVTDTRGSQVPLEAVARVEVVDGPRHDPHRGRTAQRLGVRRCQGPGHRLLCFPGQAGGDRPGEAPRPATPSPGRAATSTGSGPRSGCGWWCRSPSPSSWCCSTSTSAPC